MYENKVKVKHVKKLRKKLYALKNEENVQFVHGSGKIKTSIQRSIEKLEKYLNKLKIYSMAYCRRSAYRHNNIDYIYKKYGEFLVL